ncbi:MAG TPA: DMT family transporter [Pararhodobacter sp.]|uniref:DMT family transporter n=1 Tax=Pararhodobacter sp. TaxID=2127056 RepID=UPI002CB90BB2|nr:DMT family transporter [Pararhodobacter sp.]HPD94016.1 DMT family transporter [Pararhodobacter sp.]
MRPIRGILYKLIAVTAFIVMSSMVKAVSGTIPPGEAVFFRSAFALPVILGWLLYQGDLRTGLKTRRPISHFWRGFIGTCAMGKGFAALAFLPLPEVTAIGYAAPLLVVVFAAIFLGEEVRMFRFTAVLVGLAGVTIVLAPSLTIGASLDHAQALGAMLALMGAVCAALAQVTVRRLIATEKTATIVFWFSVTATGLSLFTIPYGWVLPSAPQLAILVLTGLVGGVGQIFLTSSYREADASLVAPFDYASILLALAIGYWVFDEVPSLTMLTGASIVVAAGILIIWRERQLGLERSRQRKAMTPQG